MSLRDVGTVKDTTTIEIVHPATGEVLPNADGSPMTVTIHGPYSARYKSVIREQQQARTKDIVRGGKAPVMTPDEIETYGRDLMARCIETWEVTLEGDEKLPCTPENIQMVMDEFPWLRDQISLAMGDVAGFLAPPKAN